MTIKTDGDARKQYEGRMNTSLQKINALWIEQEHKLATDGLAVYFKRAKYVAEIVADPDTYHDDAEELLFGARGVTPMMQTNYNNIGKRIDDKLFKVMSDHNATAAGRENPITFTHMIHLAHVGERKQILDLVKRIISEGWSITTLSQEIQSRIQRDPTLQAGNRDRSEPRPNVVASQTQKAADKLITVTAPLDDGTFEERLDTVKAADLPKLYETTKAAEEALETVCKTMQARLESVRVTRQKIERKLEELEARLEKKNSLPTSQHKKKLVKKKVTKKKVTKKKAKATDGKTTKKVAKKVSKKKKGTVPLTAEGKSKARKKVPLSTRKHDE